jgi:hypothetical protein
MTHDERPITGQDFRDVLASHASVVIRHPLSVIRFGLAHRAVARRPATWVRVIWAV